MFTFFENRSKKFLGFNYFLGKSQMQNSLLYLLSPALIPELRADVAAGAPCNVQSVLISVAAVRTLPSAYLLIRVKTSHKSLSHVAFTETKLAEPQVTDLFTKTAGCISALRPQELSILRIWAKAGKA